MDESSPGEKVAEIRVGKLAVNLVGIPLACVLVAGFVGLALMLPHRVPQTEGDLPKLLAVLILVAVSHELLHAYAFMRWGQLPLSALRFGFVWKALSPSCNWNGPVELGPFRVVALFPLYVTGGLGVAATLVYPALWVAAGAGVAVAACVGDIWMFLKLRGFSRRLVVLDARGEIGCDLYTPADPRCARGARLA